MQIDIDINVEDIIKFHKQYNRGSDDECWEWNNYTCLFYNKGKKIRVHRIAYILHYNSIPDNMLVLRSCSNNKCVNYNHLFLGTQKQITGNQKGNKQQIVDGKKQCKGKKYGCGKWLDTSQFYTHNQNSSALHSYCKTCEKFKIILKKYGLSRENYFQLLKDQNGCCKICNNKTELVIDHNHKTNKVRGLLCHRCNWQLLAALENEKEERIKEIINNLILYKK